MSLEPNIQCAVLLGRGHAVYIHVYSARKAQRVKNTLCKKKIVYLIEAPLNSGTSCKKVWETAPGNVYQGWAVVFRLLETLGRTPDSV
jgi:hypothetical protein